MNSDPINDDDASIDEMARRAGADLRRPVPEGFASGIRHMHRRRQVVRAAVGATGAAVLLAVGVFALTRPGDDKIQVTDTSAVPQPSPTAAPPASTTPATNPATVAPTTTTTTTTVAPSTTTAANTAASTLAPAGSDPDGIPDAIYAPIDDGQRQWVIDPISREVRETLDVTPQIPGAESGSLVSPSGKVTYRVETNADGLITSDECGQYRQVVDGSPSVLPAMAFGLTNSADGRVGAIWSTDCPAGQSIGATFDPVIPYDVTVAVFDPEHPDRPSRPLLSLARDDEEGRGVQLSEDGSFAMVVSAPIPKDSTTGQRFVDENGTPAEALNQRFRIVDTSTGEVIVDSAETTGDLPHQDCLLGYHGVQWESPTMFSYAASCMESGGFYIVVHDVVTGETLDAKVSERASGTEDIGTGYDVDRSTLTNPKAAWYLFWSGSSVVGEEYQTWIGHAGEPMLPIAVVSRASFSQI